MIRWPCPKTERMRLEDVKMRVQLEGGGPSGAAVIGRLGASVPRRDVSRKRYSVSRLQEHRDPDFVPRAVAPALNTSWPLNKLWFLGPQTVSGGLRDTSGTVHADLRSRWKSQWQCPPMLARAHYIPRMLHSAARPIPRDAAPHGVTVVSVG